MVIKKTFGFTLIETLMVVFVVGIIVVLGSNMFFSVLKGGSKSEFIKEAKQNGDYAMNVMERYVRNAKLIQACNPQSLRIQNNDNSLITFSCVYDGVNLITQIASDSSTLTTSNVTLGGTTCPTSTLVFDCNLTSRPQRVTISFTLSQKGASARPEEQAQTSFRKTVSLRNY